jgi:hypothetical protein
MQKLLKLFPGGSSEICVSAEAVTVRYFKLQKSSVYICELKKISHRKHRCAQIKWLFPDAKIPETIPW